MSRITRDSQGVYWLEITPDPSVELWYIRTSGGETRTFQPKNNRVRLGTSIPGQVTLTPADVTRRAGQHYAYSRVSAGVVR